MELPTTRPPTLNHNKNYRREGFALLGKIRSYLKGQSRLFLFLLGWITIYCYILNTSGAAVANEYKQLACTSVHWTNANQCGLNGLNCRPFKGSELTFRCPSGCSRALLTHPVTIGDQIVNHRPLVVGGGQNGSIPVYRGDSFICGAAIHAGVIKDSRGGCGVLRREGESQNFVGSQQNGIDSIAFDSSFPLSFSLSPMACDYEDPRWSLLAVSLLACLLLPLVLRSPSGSFAIILTAVFLHIALISDAPDEPAISNFKDVISAASGKLLPTGALANVVYRLWVSETHRARPKTWRDWIAWVLGFWTGALCNVLEQLISDMRQFQARFIILTGVFLVIQFIIRQVVYFYREGRIRALLTFYLFITLCLVVVRTGCNLTGFQLHLHHYIWPLLLLPGTTTSGYQASFWQGVLLGIYNNGLARWGFGNVVEARSSASPGSVHNTLPEIPTPVIDKSHITFEWLNGSEAGLSVLVNDVLRFQGFFDGAQHIRFRWNRTLSQPPLPYYVRVGWIKENEYRGLTPGEFTRPGIWKVDGTWSTL